MMKQGARGGQRGMGTSGGLIINAGIGVCRRVTRRRQCHVET